MDRIQLMKLASTTVSDVVSLFRDKTVSDVLDPDRYLIASLASDAVSLIVDLIRTSTA